MIQRRCCIGTPRRSRKPGGPAAEKPLLLIFAEHELLDLPRCPSTRAGGSVVFGSLPILSPGGKLRHVQNQGHKIADNCIDCHMPVESTNAIVSETAGQVIRPKMRNHWIRVYQ